MRFVLAPDKFKGSLTGDEFCMAVVEGIKEILPEAKIIELPLADGGDGTIAVINFYLKGDVIELSVMDPFFRPVQATYLYSEASQTAFIEMAEASGIKLLKSHEPDCKNTSTFGTGELILDAINQGAKHIILGIGGSATNDCGMGMATALGYRFLDVKGNEIRPVGKNLSQVVTIDDSKVHPMLEHVDFKVACDVTNPLYGPNGAAHIYARQKGALKEDIAMLDKGLKDFAQILNAHFNIQTQKIKGGGAAGGMGIGTMLFLKANLKPGIELVKELAQFEEKIMNADWIITGEGQLDAQTLSGKTVLGVLTSAKKKGIPVAAFCGDISLNEESLKEMGILYSASVMDKTKDLDEAMGYGYRYLKEISMEFANRIKNN
jgi:glycerate kinase